MKILGIFFLSIASFTPKALGDTIKLRGDIWCPYNCVPKSEKPGYIVEVAQAIFAKQGHTVDYAEMVWSKTLDAVGRGEIDGAIGASPEDRADLIFSETAVGASSTCFMVGANSTWQFAGVASLEKITLGVIEDYGYQETIDSYIKANKKNNKKIESVSGDNPLGKNMTKLAAGRIDVTLEDENVSKYFLASFAEKAKIKSGGCIPSKQKIYIGFSPKTKTGAALAKQLSDGILELRKSGKLKEILSKYGLTDW